MLAFSREGGVKNLPTGERGGGEFKNHENLLKSLMDGPLTLPGPGGGRFGHPLVSVIYCALRGVPMNSKLLEFFNYDLNLPLKNIFFQFLSTALRKLTANDINQEISSIQKHFFFHLF